MALAKSSGFSSPGALADGNMLANTVIHLDIWAAGRQRDAARPRQQA